MNILYYKSIHTKAYRVTVFLLLSLFSFSSCAQEKNMTPKAIEYVSKKEKLANLDQVATKYEIIETDLGYDENDIPLKRYEILMSNGQKLLIDTTYHRQVISPEDYVSLRIPKSSVFAFSSYFAGSLTYYYATLEDNHLSIFIQYLEENGDRSESERIKNYEFRLDNWYEISVHEEKTAKEYRDENWNPADGQYYFSEQFIYEYYNEFFPEGEVNRQGTFSFYHDPYSGTILLIKDDSYQDEMVNYILVRPQQPYIVGYTNEHGIPLVDTITQDHFYATYPDLFEKDVREEFIQNFTLITGEEKTHGTDYPYCIKPYMTKTYDVSFVQNIDYSKISLADYAHDLSNLYMLQKSKAFPENGLPIDIANQIIPGDKLITAQESLVNGRTVRYKLSCVAATTYFLSIK